NRRKINDYLTIRLPLYPTVSGRFSASGGQNTDQGQGEASPWGGRAVHVELVFRRLMDRREIIDEIRRMAAPTTPKVSRPTGIGGSLNGARTVSGSPHLDRCSRIPFAALHVGSAF